MRIKRLSLSNFRCFKREIVDLSADVVAIYGRNGVGKTAIFDALEYALVGDLARIPLQSNTSDYLSDVFSDGDLNVRVEFDGSTPGWLNVSHKRGDLSALTLSSSWDVSDRRSFVFEILLQPEFQAGRREMAIVKELVRSTILLSQELIRSFVDEEKNRYELLSFLTGSAYYQKCLKKANQVLNTLEGRVKRTEKELGDHEPEIRTLEATVAEQDARVAEIRASLGASTVTRQDLMDAMTRTGFNADVVASSSPADIVSSMRGTIEERLPALKARAQGLAGIEVTAEQHLSRLTRCTAIQEETALLGEKRETLELQIKQVSEQLPEKERTAQLAAATVKQLVERHARLRLVPEVKRQRSSLVEDKTEVTTLQHATGTRRAELEKALQGARNDIARLREQVATIGPQTELLKRRVSLLKTLRSSMAEYKSHKRESADWQKEMASLAERQDAQRKGLSAIREQLKMSRDRLASLKQAVAHDEADHNRISRLLAQLKEHINAEKCPLCGHIHLSTQDLRQAVELQLAQVPEAILLGGQHIERLSAETATLERKQNEIESTLAERGTLISTKKTEQARRDETIGQFERLVAEVDTIPDDNAIREARVAAEQSYEEIQTRMIDTQGSIAALTAKVEAIEQNRGTLGAEAEDLAKRLGGIQEKLHEVEERIATEELAPIIEQPDERIKDITNNCELELAGARKQQKDARHSLTEAQAVCQAARGEFAQLDTTRKVLGDELASLSVDIEKHRAVCRSQHLSEDVSVQSVTAAKIDVLKQIAMLESLFDCVQRYERSVQLASLESDASFANRQLVELKQEHQRKLLERTALSDAVLQAKGWISPLETAIQESVKARVNEHREEIVHLFKSMIPAPHAFEDIALRQEGSQVVMGLKYRGQSTESGEPRFFLSSAQANVLALSVFLSLGIRQECCKLETLLLDDPVQHLDDLDAVAFLDCLRSMSLGNMGKRRQIIISTCDKELYLLMIHKFLLVVESGDISFTALSVLHGGIEGPELHYDVGGPEKAWVRSKAG